MAEPKRSGGPQLPALEGARFAIVEARYYDAIGDLLLSGARAAIEAQGGVCEIVNVPGALEIPAAVQMIAGSGRYAGAIALGCVIRGETYHFEIVANESSRGLMDIGVQSRFPVGNGILTVENEEQAIVRADPKQGDKGGDAARAAMVLYALKRRMGR
ncbi:MAG: 6,7-dimethyl-8-ribityllumazine synthase [Beijerinckiaceae bacterium]